jgi:hypothetical protein
MKLKVRFEYSEINNLILYYLDIKESAVRTNNSLLNLVIGTPHSEETPLAIGEILKTLMQQMINPNVRSYKKMKKLILLLLYRYLLAWLSCTG